MSARTPRRSSAAGESLCWRAQRLVSALALAAARAGCASTAAPGSAAAARDPFEPVNRAVYEFNDVFDRAIAKPTAQAYEKLVPGFLRDMVGNAVGNARDAWTAVNQLLQGKPGHAASDAWRVAINTSFGLGGLLDVASEAGIEKHSEDFGQTLGRWGVPAGPYIVLPFLGPSSLRDAPARGVDLWADPLRTIDSTGRRNNAVLLRAIDDRQRLLDAERVVNEAALDRYSFIRDSWLQLRRNQVYDGNPPASSQDTDWLDELEREESDAGGAAPAAPSGSPANERR
ncbi:MAG: VacJ family lipoprotein [Burkholderiaceae bacterium]|nr:VacJ family lipoprotein [Burkholderiaceae bacterium]